MAEEDTWDQEIDSEQSFKDEDSAYIDDSMSENEEDYDYEPGIEEPEPEPPDQVRDISRYKKWSEEEDEWGEQEYEENDPREETWTEDDDSHGGYGEDTFRGELNTKPPDNRWSFTRSNSHQTSTLLKPTVSFNSDYQPANEFQLYAFSGRRNYLKWERNMDEWFYYNNIQKEERLTYAIDQLTGDAYQWWLQEEDDHWFYKEPTITTWRGLKELLRDKYAPKVLNSKIKELYPRSYLTPKVISRAPQANGKGQGKHSVSQHMPELTCYRSKNRDHTTKESLRKKGTPAMDSRYERSVTQRSNKRGVSKELKQKTSPTRSLELQARRMQGLGETQGRAVQEHKSTLVTEQKKTPYAVMTRAQLAHTKVSTSTAPKDFYQLFNEKIHLIMSARVEKGLGTKEDSDPTNCRDLQVNKKQEIISASNNERVQAKLSQSVYNNPITGMMHLPFSKGVETDAGPKEEPCNVADQDKKIQSVLSLLDTLVPIPYEGEQCKLVEPERKTQPEPSPPKLEPQDKQPLDKSSNTLNLLKVICYRCQGVGHIAKVCPTKRLANEPSLELKKTSFKDCGNSVETNLNIPSASILHLSLPKDVETGLGMTSEEVDQKETPEEDTTHSVLSKEISLEPYIRLEQGKCLEPVVLIKTHQSVEDAGRTGSYPKLSGDKETRNEVKTLVERTQEDELDHEFNPEPNNKWKPKTEQGIDHAMSKPKISASITQHTSLDSVALIHLPYPKEVERGIGMEERHSKAHDSLTYQDEDYEQSVFEPFTPADLASKKMIVKVESLQNLLCGTQVSETQNLIQVRGSRKLSLEPTKVIIFIWQEVELRTSRISRRSHQSFKISSKQTA